MKRLLTKKPVLFTAAGGLFGLGLYVVYTTLGST
jgi:hypothetical protein